MSNRLEDHLTRIGGGLSRCVTPMRLTAQRAESLRAALAALAAHRSRAAVDSRSFRIVPSEKWPDAARWSPAVTEEER